MHGAPKCLSLSLLSYNGNTDVTSYYSPLLLKNLCPCPMMGFPDSSAGKESACNAGDPGSIPGLGRSTGEGISYPLQYSWASLVAQLVKNLPAMQETWVGKIPWKRERLLTPVSWPGEFHGLYSPWGHKESDTTERFSRSPSHSRVPVLLGKGLRY